MTANQLWMPVEKFMFKKNDTVYRYSNLWIHMYVYIYIDNHIQSYTQIIPLYV